MQLDTHILDRFLAGDATAAEAAQVHAWLAEDPARAQLVESLRGEPARAWEVDAAWQRVAADVRPGRRDVLPLAPRARPFAHAARLARIAALLVIGLGVFTLWRAYEGGTPELLAAAPRGQRISVALTDGSSVVLAPESSLRAPRRFGWSRDVTLEGEAYFDVAHRSGRPFRVHAAGSLTRVLGTQFSVNARAGAGEVRVVLAQGRVSFGREGARSPAVLEPGQRAVLSRQGTVAIDRVDASGALAWTAGRIRIDGLPLAEAAPILERWLNVRIIITDSALARRRITTTLNADSAAAALEAIGVALDAQVRRAGGTIMIGKQ
jgi:transmembrane sensor